MDNLRGISLMVLAMAAFAVEDAFIKAAAHAVPTGQILVTIGAVGGGAFALYARSRGVRLFGPVLWSRAVILRNVTEIFGTLGFVTAITTIPLATASAIAQAVPLVITAGAAFIFGETVGWRRWSAVLAGLAGVLIILRPGLSAFDPNTLWAVLAVVGLAGRDLASRAVPREVSHLQLATYGLLTAIPSGLLLMPFTGAPVMPAPPAAGLLACAIAVGGVAYYAITSATRTGDIAVVTPFRYTRILFALLIGLAVFGEIPDLATLAGAALIVASGTYTLLRERARVRAAAHPAPAYPDALSVIANAKALTARLPLLRPALSRTRTRPAQKGRTP
ncbi:DMT family transporter [Roseivivax sediminis]|uniref:Permease of the drug/metabolite transporter (DMT) superfamily n=1 Tax=Roseivivax sediminis TaxID=936889 RepID=A0A1I1YVA6_9RHOB|nr:DMT family transporter [Roseivivax sediminis]SFE22918.1 Permease of the drug/metabolite transporter (DMT) superfamily [Roseivivax sediminis]